MYLNRAALKANARQAMRESRTSPYVTALIYIVVVYIIGLLTARLMRVDTASLLQLAGSKRYLEDPEYVLRWYSYNRPGVFAYVLDLLLRIMTVLLGAGFTIFTLRLVRRLENSLWNLMDGFQYFLKIIGLCIVMDIFIFLWSLLFVFPGVIAAYRYRQALYLLLDHPEMGIMACISESKRLMRGHKLELFVLDLSFIGWQLLTIIPFVSVYVLPYTESTYALYYTELVRAHEAPGPDQGPREPWEY